MSQKLDIDFFGLSIYEMEYMFDKERKQWNCYFVLDLGGQTTNPILLWSMIYVNEKTIRGLREMCTNPSLALLYARDKTGLPNALKVVVELKMRFFASDVIPIKDLTELEYKKRYSKLNSKENKIPQCLL